MLKNWFRWLILLAVVAIAGALLPAPVQARSLQEDKVVFGGTYVLPRGEVLNGNLTVIGGQAIVQREARVTGNAKVVGGKLIVQGAVEGDVSLTGGEAFINGKIGGDLRVLGGEARLGKHAEVAGTIHSVGGVVRREEPTGPRVGPGSNGLPPWDEAPGPNAPWNHPVNTPLHLLGVVIWRGFLAFLRAVALAVVAALLMLVLESPTRAIVQQMEESALIASGVGLMSMALMPVVLLVLVITLVLIPLAVVLGMAWGVAILWGWLAVGLLLGERGAKALKLSWPPMVSAAAGTFVLTLMADSLRLIPCIGWIPGFLVASLGLGAALLAGWEAWQRQQARRSTSNGDNATLPPSAGGAPGHSATPGSPS